MNDNFTPFNGNFIASDGSIKNIDELLTAASSGSGGISIGQVQSAISDALVPVKEALSDKASMSDIPDVSAFLTQIPNATAAEVGGIKLRVDGTKLFITTDGTNP
ncbi:MAG: hypothetical protein FWC81_04110 [Coriobacteriia bacterium]|nr:hypothetical protein [Coriobacteriia bacterium]